jgi:DNA mismatch repair protein MSH4
MSTFSLEMREVAFILRNIDGRSLCIVDELGRGTSTRDGLAIAIAICEALVQSRSLVFFATHFAELARVMGDRPGVLNLHLQSECTVVDEIPKMCMTYKVAEGPLKEKGYGIGLAAAFGFPKRMLEVAHGVAEALRSQAEERQRSGKARRVLERRKLLLMLRETLMQVWESRLGDQNLREYLERLQKEYIERLSALEDD